MADYSIKTLTGIQGGPAFVSGSEQGNNIPSSSDWSNSYPFVGVAMDDSNVLVAATKGPYYVSDLNRYVNGYAGIVNVSVANNQPTISSEAIGLVSQDNPPTLSQMVWWDSATAIIPFADSYGSNVANGQSWAGLMFAHLSNGTPALSSPTTVYSQVTPPNVYRTTSVPVATVTSDGKLFFAYSTQTTMNIEILQVNASGSTVSTLRSLSLPLSGYPVQQGGSYVNCLAACTNQGKVFLGDQFGYWVFSDSSLSSGSYTSQYLWPVGLENILTGSSQGFVLASNDNDRILVAGGKTSVLVYTADATGNVSSLPSYTAASGQPPNEITASGAWVHPWANDNKGDLYYAVDLSTGQAASDYGTEFTSPAQNAFAQFSVKVGQTGMYLVIGDYEWYLDTTGVFTEPNNLGSTPGDRKPVHYW